MIDIQKIEDLFFSKLGNGYIKFTALYTNIEGNDYYKISKEKLVTGIENIVERDWLVKPILTFDLDSISGTHINIEQFLGSHFDKKSNSIILHGQKKWWSHYFIYPYEENYKLRVEPPKFDLHKTTGFSSCFEEEKGMGGTFEGTNIELNKIFREIKKEPLEIEKPKIIYWNDKWSNYFDHHTEDFNSDIWTLLYPESELTLLLITEPYI